MLEKFPKIVFWNVGTVEKSFQNSKLNFLQTSVEIPSIDKSFKTCLILWLKKGKSSNNNFLLYHLSILLIFELKRKVGIKTQHVYLEKYKILKIWQFKVDFFSLNEQQRGKKGIWEKQTRFKIVSCIFNVIQHTLKWICFVSLFLVLSMYMGNFLRTMCG